MVNASALKWRVLHCWDCFCTTVNVASVMQYILILPPIGTVQCCSVVEYSRSFDGSGGRLVIGDVLSDILHCHFDCILN